MTWLLASWLTVLLWLAGAGLNQLVGGSLGRWVYRLLVAFPISYLFGEMLFYLLGILASYVLVWWVLRIAFHSWEATGYWPEPVVIIRRALARNGQRWPLVFLLPLTVLVVAGSVAVLSGSLHVYHWELAGVLLLGLWAHFLAEPEMAPVEDVEEVAQPGDELVPEEPMPASDFVKLLRDDRSYRGQIYWEQDVPAKEPRFYSGAREGLLRSQVVLHALDQLGIDRHRGLYAHQGTALEEISKADPARGRRNHVLLCTPRGSGRSTISALAALHRVLDEHCNVLFVYPTKRVGELEEARFERILRAAGLRWSIHWDTIWDDHDYKEKEQNGERSVPEVLFTTARVLHRHILPDHREWAMFMGSLDLIVADDLELYRGAFGSNGSFVFRRLRRLCALHGANPQFLAVCLPFKNYHLFSVMLLGVRFEQKAIIGTDSRGTKERMVLFWNPPLDRPEKEGTGQIVARRPYLREASELLLKTARYRLYPILLSKAVRMTLCDVQDFEGQLKEDLRTLMGEDKRIPVGTSVAEVEIPEEGFNSIIMSGFPGPSSMVRHELEHMRGEAEPDGFLCIVTPSTPLAQYYLRCGDRYLEFKDPASSIIISNDNTNIVANHLKCSLWEHPLRLAEIDEYFGRVGLAVLEDLAGRGQAVREQWEEIRKGKPRTIEVYSLVDRPDDKPHDLISLSSSSLTQVEVSIKAEGKVVDTLDSNRVPDQAYPGAVYYFEDERYEVLDLQGDGSRVELQLCGKALETHKLGNVIIEVPDADKHKQKLTFDGGRTIVTGCATGTAKEQVVGRVEYDFVGEGFASDRLQKVVEFPGGGYGREPFQTRVGFVSFPGANHPEVSEAVMHSLVHLCKILLPVFVVGGESECGIDYDMAPADLGSEATLFFYDNVEQGLGYADLLMDNVRALFTEAYEVLRTCPCGEGCEACLEIPDCHRLGPNNTLNWGLDKSNTMRLLGHVLSREGFETIIRDRTEGMEDIERVGELKDRIVGEIFRHKLDMRVLDPAIVTFMTEEEQHERPGVGGFFEGGERNRVAVSKVPEGKMVGLLAHEYAHNWQFEDHNMHPRLVGPEVPFNGRLLLEGFAQWVEYKICDFYGLKNEMAAADFAHPDQCDEYSEGFQVIKYIEDMEGVKGVLDFVTTGGLDGPHEDLVQLYEDAGVAQDIWEKVRRLEDSGRKLPEDDWLGLSDWLTTFPSGAPAPTEIEPESIELGAESSVEENDADTQGPLEGEAERLATEPSLTGEEADTNEAGQ